jgi:hypothetical protein
LAIESRQEVLTVKTILITTRPSALAAACAPVSTVTVGAPQLSQVHQVQPQAELTWALVRTGASYGINGSTVKGIETIAMKRFVDGARGGVPPRGRPV